MSKYTKKQLMERGELYIKVCNDVECLLSNITKETRYEFSDAIEVNYIDENISGERVQVIAKEISFGNINLPYKRFDVPYDIFGLDEKDMFATVLLERIKNLVIYTYIKLNNCNSFMRDNYNKTLLQLYKVISKELGREYNDSVDSDFYLLTIKTYSRVDSICKKVQEDLDNDEKISDILKDLNACIITPDIYENGNIISVNFCTRRSINSGYVSNNINHLSLNTKEINDLNDNLIYTKIKSKYLDVISYTILQFKHEYLSIYKKWENRYEYMQDHMIGNIADSLQS